MLSKLKHLHPRNVVAHAPYVHTCPASVVAIIPAKLFIARISSAQLWSVTASTTCSIGSSTATWSSPRRLVVVLAMLCARMFSSECRWEGVRACVVHWDQRSARATRSVQEDDEAAEPLPTVYLICKQPRRTLRRVSRRPSVVVVKQHVHYMWLGAAPLPVMLLTCNFTCTFIW